MAFIVIFIAAMVFFDFFVMDGDGTSWLIKKAGPTRALSHTSASVYRAWREIPKDHRPENPTEILKALDEKYQQKGSENHFYRDGECHCYYNHRCQMPEFLELFNEFKAIKTALDQRVSRMAEIERGQRYEEKKADVELYMERLRSEKEIQTQVNRELF